MGAMETYVPSTTLDSLLTYFNPANPLLSATPMPGTSALPSSPPPRAGLFGKVFSCIEWDRL